MYLNISDERPENRYMSGHYLVGDTDMHNPDNHKFSIPVEIDRAASDDDRLCDKHHKIVRFTEDFKLPWVGNHDDFHISDYLKNMALYVSADMVSKEPVFKVITPEECVQAIRDYHEAEYDIDR